MAARAPSGIHAEGDRSVAASEISNSVIIPGDHNYVVVRIVGRDGDLADACKGAAPLLKRARQAPLSAYPAAAGDHVDRENEASAILDGALASPVNVYGPSGIGKTYLLTYAANKREAQAHRDGIVLLDGAGKRRLDLLVALFQEFHDDLPPDYMPTEDEVSRVLRSKQALVLVDDFALDRDEAQRFFQAASRCRFVVASEQRTVWQGTSVRIDGLGFDDAIVLMERELGRPVTDAERPAAEAIHRALAGSPARTRPVVSLCRELGLPLEELARRIEGAGAAVDVILESSSSEERRVLAALAVFGSAPIDGVTISAIADVANAEVVLDRLRGRGLVDSGPSGYRLTGIPAADLESRMNLDADVGRAVAYLAPRLEQHPDGDDAHEARIPALVALLRSARQRRRHADVLTLGTAISAVLVLSRQWGVWEEVLDAVLISSRHVGDRSTEGWALHQIGTRQVCLGDRRAGTDNLRQALRVRKAIGDTAGAGATRHNLVTARRLRPLDAIWRRLPAVVLALALLTGVAGGTTQLLVAGDEAKDLSLVLAGEGRGTVTSAPSGIDCGSACAMTFDAGTQVSLTAVAVPGSAFAGWQGGGCSGDSTCTIRLADRTTVTARFVTLATSMSLTVGHRGDGKGTVTSAPTGIACPPSCQAGFDPAKPVTLTAAAAPGSVFAGWEGAGCTGTGLCEVSPRVDQAVAAVFQLDSLSRRLTVVREGQGLGRVTSSPAAIDCGVSCTASFPERAEVTLVATALTGSVFDGWEGSGCAGTDRCTVTVSSPATVKARFRRSVNTHDLTVDKAGAGAVRSTPTGIDCGPSCTASFSGGTEVTLTATAEAGSVFGGWTGGGCAGTGSCTLTVGAASRVSAEFRRAAVTRKLAVSVKGPGKGTVTASQGGIDCPPSCSASLPDGTEVTLTAAALKGSAFGGWSHPGCAGRAPCTVTVRQDTSVVVTFDTVPTPRQLTVKVATPGGGTVASEPSGIKCPTSCTAGYSKGTVVVLVATPKPGFVFGEWSGGGCSGTGACKVTLHSDTSVTATFDPGVVLDVTVRNGAENRYLEISAKGAETITCRSTCRQTFRKGSEVTLAAAPNGYFTWTSPQGLDPSGKACTEIALQCTFPMTSHRTLDVLVSEFI